MVMYNIFMRLMIVSCSVEVYKLKEGLVRVGVKYNKR